MKNSLNDNNKFDFSKINIDTILTFCKNNTRYVSAGVLTVILVVVLAITAVNGSKNGTESNKDNVNQEQTADSQKAYEVSENKELNQLIDNYYKLYVAGNVDELSKIATPVSDMEKSYIQMMSGYLEAYNNIKCYTKEGLEKDSYFVSVTYDMKFKDAGSIPGMESFYVRINGEGKLYIDNLYSSFNYAMKEQTMDADVAALIEEYEKDAEVMELIADFQNRYTQAIASDESLQNMVNTVKAGIDNWKNTQLAQQTAEEQAAAQQAAAEQAAAEQAAAEQAAAQQAAAEQAAAQQAAAEQAAAEQAAQQQAEQQETNNGLNYLPEGTTLTANDAYNIRVSMSETSDKVGTTAIGDKLKIILSYEEGWTKVEWNGKTGFIKTDLLLKN